MCFVAVTHKAPLIQHFHFLWKTRVRLFVVVRCGISSAERISQRNIIRKKCDYVPCQMPFLNWLGRAQNKNVLKTIFFYGSSLSVLPKVMNHWVNQTGILWFLICLPLISWVACRDLIWDCLPFLYGSMEGQCGEWWGKVGAFSYCSTRSCTTTRKVDNPHLFSSLLFYSMLFWASLPRLLSLVFPPPHLIF